MFSQARFLSQMISSDEKEAKKNERFLDEYA